MRNAELTLDQMLADVIVQMVMRRDRVTEAEIRELMAGFARRRGRAGVASQDDYRLSDAA